MRFIYADNAATTRLSDTALKAMLPYLREEYGNASTLYKLGRSAHNAVASARRTFADGIQAIPAEIFFTSGGTESDNWAIKGTAHRLARLGKRHIVTDNIEHPAVLNSVSALAREGFEITYVKADADGVVPPQAVRAAIRPDTALVSVMFANNELGTIQPVAEIGRICHDAGVLFHCDAVQAAGILPINVQAMNIDLLSISAHKFHGAKGVGVLYARRGCAPEVYIDGGEQEYHHRAGTENVAGIVGMAVALREHCEHLDQESCYLKSLTDFLLTKLYATGLDFIVNGSDDRIPGSLSISFAKVDGEMLLHRLDLLGTAVATGSACDSKGKALSHVIRAIGVPETYARGTIRISLGMDNDKRQVEEIVRQLCTILR